MSAKHSETCDKIAEAIQKQLTFPLNFLGTVRRFNGVDVDQTQNYNHIHCSTYIDKIVDHHKWQNLTTRTPPTPMCANNKHQANLQLARGPDEMTDAKSLEQNMGFNYHQAIGELIYAYTIC